MKPPRTPEEERADLEALVDAGAESALPLYDIVKEVRAEFQLDIYTANLLVRRVLQRSTNPATKALAKRLIEAGHLTP